MIADNVNRKRKSLSLLHGKWLKDFLYNAKEQPIIYGELEEEAFAYISLGKAVR
ncbi:hypothetical protein HMPREF9087_1609 [Enterococcus casseliflavus ATCC 12755]|uniref:Uncharacterized protein n=1 Tax=Enterococcus casseliflavus ATCC 12755 TaxID=888066 RepID=F0EJP6_ENTCA|nr:hypothetical protein HMPREF9087_1609 [Enterococcus casseliflavus ATCC 12755]